jgi:preprotein translocase subunit SecE
MAMNKAADAASETEKPAGGAVAVDKNRKIPLKKATDSAKVPAKTVKAKPAKAQKQNKKGLFQRIGQYFKEVAGELKKVHWPTRHELLTYTGVVLASVGILAVLTWVVDSGLSYVLIELLGR